MTDKEKKTALIIVGVIILAFLAWLFRAHLTAQPATVDNTSSDDSSIPQITLPGVAQLPPLEGYIPNSTNGVNYSGSSYVASGCALCSMIGYNNLTTPSQPAQEQQAIAPAEIVPYVATPSNAQFGATAAFASSYPTYIAVPPQNSTMARMF